MISSLSRIKVLVLSLAIFFLSASFAHAATYYVSSTGSDSNTGTSSSAPWQTLSKVNSATFVAGDSILFKRGDTFFGSLAVDESGTSSNPITYGAYGSGAKPVITGYKTLTNWVSVGNGVYESYDANFLSTVNMVSFNGNVQPMGRYPKITAANKGYLKYQSHSGTTSITSNAISGAPSFVGGQVVIRKNPWILDKGTITSQNSSTVAFTGIGNAVTGIWDNYGFFFQNHINTLTQLGEWAYNANTKKVQMYFGSNNPSSYTVKASAVELTVAMNAKYIVLDNLTLSGSNRAAVQVNYFSSNITIKNSDIMQSGTDAIYVTNYEASPGLVITGNNITDTNNTGIAMETSGNCLIKDNYFYNTGVIPGASSSGGGNAQAIGYMGANCTVDHNRIINTGYVGIHMNGNNTTIKNNFIDTFNTVKDDGGGIYGWNTPTVGGSQILDNIVINGIGAPEGTPGTEGAAFGIYMDDYMNGVTIKGNTVAFNSNGGLYLHNAKNIVMQNNTAFDNHYSQWNFTNDGCAMANIDVQYNTFFSKLANQIIGSQNNPCESIGSYTNTAGWGPINNNYYVRPLATTGIYVVRHGPCCDQWTLDQWKTATGKDANTVTSPVSLSSTNDIIFEYNASDSSRTVALSGNYVDSKNTTYSGSVTIPPWGSVVLMKSSGGTPLDNTIPTVSLTAPAAGTVTGTITLSANASDNIGVTKVEFYRGTTLISSDTSSPYSVSWNTVGVTNGSYSLTAKAYDAAGNVATSTARTITVSNNGSANLINVGVAVNDSGFVWRVGQSFGTPADTAEYPTRSTLRIFEDGVELFSPHATGATISSVGRGNFSHWDDGGGYEALYFSTSDNSNPKTNGRAYTYVVGTVPNTPPIANAGADKTITLPTSSVSLTGSASDPDNNTPLTYAWTKVSGGSATISSPTSLTTNITGLTQGTYTFWLTVTDSRGATNADAVMVTVNPAVVVNTPPTANAGADKTITLPTNSVSLSGSGTDAGGSISTYSWTKVSGGSATIASPSAATTNITGLVQGTYTFRLTVTDNGGLTGSDDVVVTVNPAAAVPQNPVANAGPDQAITGSTTTLTGSGTDADGTIVSYRWTRVSGSSTAQISSPRTASTGVTRLRTGTYVFRLTVTDNSGRTGTDTVTVVVGSTVSNTPPTANAGVDKTITLPTSSVSLSGSGSDTNGTITGYAWTKVSGGSATIASPSSATTNITGLAQGSYTFRLTVTDNGGLTGSDDVTVTVNAGVSLPANVIDMSGAVSYQGFGYFVARSFGTPADNGSNQTRSLLRFFENGTELSPAHSLHADIASIGRGRFSHWAEGTFEALFFSTSDNSNPKTNGRTYTYSIAASASNTSPVANAGSDKVVVLPTSSVSLAGSGTDADGSIASYKWTKVSGDSATISASTSATTNITGLTIGEYVFRLTVTDNQGATASDDVKVIVRGLVNTSTVGYIGGYAYYVGQNFGIPADDIGNPTRSTLRVFENGVEMGPAHSGHSNLIGEKGEGRFSHWDDNGGYEALYFSAIDNSNPKTNGKVYTYQLK